MSEKTYIKGVQLKEAGKYNTIRFSGKTDEFIEQLKSITNEKGYFNLDINKRRDVGKYGETHSMTVNDWKPNDNLPR